MIACQYPVTEMGSVSWVFQVFPHRLVVLLAQFKEGKMIKLLEITNFQGHKYSLLEFHNGVNIIKGRSHSGKSSIIRALKWALQNKPSGFHFKSHFSKKNEATNIAIEFDEGTWVDRQRHPKFNGYTSSEFEKIEALRTDLPEEVKDITRIGKINIQSQADKYFMLKESPGAVAKELNSIVGLDIIDEMYRKVSGIVNSANAESLRIHKEIEEKKEEIAKYKNLDKIEKLITKISTLHNQNKGMKDREESLDVKIGEIEEIREELDGTKEWLSIEEPFKRIKKLNDGLKELRKERTDLLLFVVRCNRANTGIDNCNKKISFESKLKEVKSLSSKLSEMKNKHVELKKLYDAIQKVKKSLNFVSDTLKMDLKERKQLLKSHEDEFCSKCGAHMQYWRKGK